MSDKTYGDEVVIHLMARIAEHDAKKERSDELSEPREKRDKEGQGVTNETD